MSDSLYSEYRHEKPVARVCNQTRLKPGCSATDTIYKSDRRQSKTLLKSTNAEQKSTETVFSIAICRQSGDKWQSKTLLLTIFDLRSSIVLTFSIAAYPVWILKNDIADCL